MSQNDSIRALPVGRYRFTSSTYPGRRPRFSFLLTRTGIYRLKVRKLDRLLEHFHLAPSTERYAVLAYGSNACPGQLLDKELSDVPVIFGRLDGAQAVYARRTTQKGYVPATLAKKRGSRYSWVTLLTSEQLRIMDRSEGRPNVYALASVPGVQFYMGRSRLTPLYSYVDIRGGVMISNGEPVSLHSTGQERAKSLLPKATPGPAADWLDFETIPYPNSPTEYSQIVR